MRAKWCRGLLVAVSGMLALFAAGASLAQAHPYEHPQQYRNEKKTVGGERVPQIIWSTVKLNNPTLSYIECVNLVYGVGWNETEPGAETERAYGEVLQWTATGYLNKEYKEPSARCVVAAGVEAYAAVEPPIVKKYEVATVEGKEKRVLKEAKREPPTVPWNQEAIGEITPRGQEIFRLKTGLVKHGETKEETAKTCYPGTEVTERVHTAEEAETTEKVLKTAPQGCIRVDIIVPAFGLEVAFQGSLTAKTINGAHNGLSPSHGTFTVSESGKLESLLGEGTTESLLEFKDLGFNSEELMTVGLP
jgi:hypothetical protein